MNTSRRNFLKASATGLAATSLASQMSWAAKPVKVPVVAHLFVYSLLFPESKTYDAYPAFDRAFGEVKAAGFDGIELMAVNLQHDDAVENIGMLSKKYGIAISGCSMGMNMWKAESHSKNVDDAVMVLDRLQTLGGKTFGLSVGDAKRTKTEAELDSQASVLREIRVECTKRGILPNLHNHIYELQDGMHDLKGTLSRIPDFPLGPDFNWMIRAKVDPVEFIHTYGKQIVYMHLRDQDASGAWTEYLGTGATDFKAIAAALKDAKFHGRCGVEHALPAGYVPKEPLGESWKRSREFVRATFGW